MKKSVLLIFMLLIYSFSSSIAQETEKPAKEEDKLVYSSFESGILIDNQTNIIPDKRTLEMLIQHRFGTMDNGFKDLFGIYAPGANIRIGFNYSIIDRLMVGYGLTMKNMYSDFQVKYALLRQTERRIPVAVTLYGNMAIDSREKEAFGVNYSFTNRLSYFGQVIVGRKFADWLSLQVQGSFTHYNSVEKDTDWDKIGVGINGRIKVSDQSSIMFQYDHPISILDRSDSKPNLGFGYEIATYTHSFQIYVNTAQGIIPQDNYMYNQNDFTKGEMMFGFTITRLFGL